jgi:hypothetical protein
LGSTFDVRAPQACMNCKYLLVNTFALIATASVIALES